MSGQVHQGMRVTQKRRRLARRWTDVMNGCSAAGAVCSVVSKVTGTDCRGSGGEWVRGGGGQLRHREG